MYSVAYATSFRIARTRHAADSCPTIEIYMGMGMDMEGAPERTGHEQGIYISAKCTDVHIGIDIEVACWPPPNC